MVEGPGRVATLMGRRARASEAQTRRTGDAGRVPAGQAQTRRTGDTGRVPAGQAQTRGTGDVGRVPAGPSATNPRPKGGSETESLLVKRKQFRTKK